LLQEAHNRVHSDGDVTAHSELLLARWAAQNLAEQTRRDSTLYTSCEHCAMCAGAHHQAGIGRIVFALSLEQLAEVWPPDVPILRLGVREVMSRSTKPIEIVGPCDQFVGRFQELHRQYWERRSSRHTPRDTAW
jgi:tRNA(Arg) A34 adenosine deaminase TadA